MMKKAVLSFVLAGSLFGAVPLFSQPGGWDNSAPSQNTTPPQTPPPSQTPPPAQPTTPQPAAPVGTLNIVGNYFASGTNPGGRGSYRGVVKIEKDGDKYFVFWKIGNSSYGGLGVLEGNQFKVVWGTAKEPTGVVKYTVQQDGTLVGSWYSFKNPNAIGTETLTPSR